jgi:hypothetical protein
MGGACSIRENEDECLKIFMGTKSKDTPSHLGDLETDVKIILK